MGNVSMEMNDEELLWAVSDPALYGCKPHELSVIQTHISVVVLVGSDVYKFKKRVSFGFLDFTTIEARRAACEEEVDKNRRLCPNVYRGVVELRRDRGRLVLGGESGAVVDYAVWMARLPEERMLNRLLESDAVSRDDIEELARLVADFHAKASRSPEVLEAGAPEKLRDYALANFPEILDTGAGFLDARLLTALEGQTRNQFERILPLMRRRCGEGHVVDGHGDLHSRNICMTEPPAVYDCLEFSQSLRCGDTATDNAFLYMDLSYRGRRDLADAYLQEYVRATGDDEQRQLLLPLCGYRAMVRAKVSVLKAAEREQGEGAIDAARDSARRHVLLAAALAAEQASPTWVLACGLPGTGKSTLLAELSRLTCWPRLATDLVRKETAGVEPGVRLEAGAYTKARRQAVYREVVALARKHRCALLDAGFRTRADRQVAIDAAREVGARVVVLWLQTDEATTARWLDERGARGGSASDADASVYAKLKAEFEPPRPDEGLSVVEVRDPTAAGACTERMLLELLSP